MLALPVTNLPSPPSVPEESESSSPPSGDGFAEVVGRNEPKDSQDSPQAKQSDSATSEFQEEQAPSFPVTDPPEEAKSLEAKLSTAAGFTEARNETRAVPESTPKVEGDAHRSIGAGMIDKGDSPGSPSDASIQPLEDANLTVGKPEKDGTQSHGDSLSKPEAAPKPTEQRTPPVLPESVVNRSHRDAPKADASLGSKELPPKENVQIRDLVTEKPGDPAIEMKPLEPEGQGRNEPQSTSRQAASFPSAYPFMSEEQKPKTQAPVTSATETFAGDERAERLPLSRPNTELTTTYHSTDLASQAKMAAPQIVSDLNIAGEAPLPSTQSQADAALGSDSRPMDAAPKPTQNVPVQELPRPAMLQIVEAMRTGTGLIDVTLSPEELGRVTLSVGTHEGHLSVLVMADRAETTEAIRRSLDLLLAEAHAAGFEDVSLDFAAPDGGGNSRQQDEAEEAEALPTLAVDVVDVGPHKHTASSIDLRL